ncbi:major facilitator superfamily domain-containing protein [Xylariaceae sp. FL0662B]|nr:major facilitator superfamily domain-containing protein [Xylariaceae sp. FL0662B]
MDDKTADRENDAIAADDSQHATNDRRIEDPPDGGLGWLQVLVAHLTLFNNFGYFNSFGIFEEYYSTHLGLNLSTLSWTGSIQVFLLLGIGVFTGRLFDAGYFRSLVVAGSVLQLIGTFMTSLASSYWQIFLAQGLATGIGAGLIYCPVMANVATYFDKKRALALALVTSGTAIGGVIYPVIAQQLLAKVGFGWTMRCMGFVMLFNFVVIIAFARRRLPPRPSGPLVELAAFKELPYSSFSVGIFLSLWAVYIGYTYINHYGVAVLGIDSSTSLNLLLILNALGCPGRILPALISDAFAGPFQTAVPLVFGSGILYFGWMGIGSWGSLLAFAVLFGFVNGGVQGMLMAGLPSLTTDLSKMGTRTGMILSIASVATLTGPPVAGALIDAGGGRYTYLQIWGGCSMIVSACFLIGASLTQRLRADIST